MVMQTIGSIANVQSSKSSLSFRSRRSWSCIISFGIVFISLLSFTIIIISSFILPICSCNHEKVSTVKGSQLKPVVILYNTPYFGPKHRIVKSYNDRVRPSNWGDWVWKYAAHIMLDHSKVITCNVSRVQCMSNYKSASKFIQYFPFANDMATGFLHHPVRIQKMNTSAQLIRKTKDTFFALGLGTQSEFSATRQKQDLGMALSIEIKPQDMELHNSSVDFLSELKSMKQVAFFRGSFTNKLAQLHGYRYGLETGCPTLMINHDIALGRTLQKKYDDVSRRVGDRTLRIALNSNPEHIKVQQFCARIMRLYPNALLYAQIGNDVQQFRKSGIPFERLRIFEGDVLAWMNDIKDMDIAFGPRIHGNMVAMAADPPIPVFVLAPDHRVLELVQTMKVPYTDIYDRRLQKEDVDIAELVRDYQFDGREFDRNRCAIAQHYVREFSAVGVHVASHIVNISQTC